MANKWTVVDAVNDIPMLRADITIKDNDVVIEHFYFAPGTLDSDGEPVPPTGWITPGYAPEFSYSRFLYALDLRERAAKRESVAETSTVYYVSGKPRDLMALPLAEAVLAINSARMLVKLTGKNPGKAFENAAARLTENGSVLDTNGVLAIAKKAK